jgi:hypothetical protein
MGLEDVRIFSHKNQIYYIGSYFNKQKNAIQVASNILDAKSDILYPIAISPSFETSNNWEKNWVFFEYKNDVHVIYKWKPVHICKINFQTQKLDLINMNNNVPNFFGSFRGSTNGIGFDEKILFVTHLHRINQDKKQYIHVFVVFDKDMNLLGYSDPFNFENYLVEFCIGITYNDIKGNYILTYSTLDRTTKLAVFSKEYINSLIQYIY